MKKAIPFFLAAGGIAIVLALLAAFVTGGKFGDVVGTISIVTSVVLSVVATLYAYVSGKETLNLLEKIETQNKKLVAKINQDLLKGAYDEEGLENARNDDHIELAAHKKEQSQQ
jgi:cell shape-determining protein MreC